MDFRSIIAKVGSYMPTLLTDGIVVSSVIADGAVTLDKVTTDVISASHPVGCLYFSTTDTDPAATLGFGTWSAFAQGQVLVGAGTFTDSNSEERIFAAGDQEGEYSHTLTEAEMPSHTHTLVARTGVNPPTGGATTIAGDAQAGSYDGENTGGDEAHNNMQPSIAVYIWRRTA